VSAFEKYNDIRYQCHNIDENIEQLGSTLDMIDYSPNSECVQVPLELFQKMQQYTLSVQKDFKAVQSEWSDFFDE
jgi:hypothetical protein